MTHGAVPPARRPRLAVAAGLLIVFGMLVGAGGTRPTGGATARPGSPAAAVGPAGTMPNGFAPPAAAPGTAAPAEPSSPPVELAIPAIGVRSGLVGLRLGNDGELQVPTDYALAGWYSDGPAPGDPGAPAVIAGHVDSTNAPAVFYRLRELTPGQQVLFRRADGTTARFVVDELADYSKTGFPAGKVYAPTPRPEVRLITCTGSFNSATGHYLDNLVVFAHQDPGGASS